MQFDGMESVNKAAPVAMMERVGKAVSPDFSRSHSGDPQGSGSRNNFKANRVTDVVLARPSHFTDSKLPMRAMTAELATTSPKKALATAAKADRKIAHPCCPFWPSRGDQQTTAANCLEQQI
jgi:hypothetical protein